METDRVDFLFITTLENIWSIVGSHVKDDRRVVIFLDLNWDANTESLGKIKEVREDEAKKHFPIIIYSKSDVEEDISKSYAATANAYIIKDGGPVESKRKFLDALEQWGAFYQPPFGIL